MPAVVQSLVEPLVGDRRREDGPVLLLVDPGPHLVGELRLQEEEVPALADLEVGAAAHGRAGLDQVGGVEQPGAVLALVAAGGLVAAVRAGADDVAVGQEAAVVDRVDLLGHPLLDEALLLEPPGEVLGQLLVLLGGAAPEVLPRKPEPLAEIPLDGVLAAAVLGDVEARLERGELGRGAVLVGGADEEDVLAPQAQVAGVHVGGQHRADEVAQVLDPVDVRAARS